MSSYTTAFVRSVPYTFVDCIRPEGTTGAIDVDLARTQHDAYVDILVTQGLGVTRIEADPRYPDCCFVEDPAVVFDDVAVVCNMAAEARRGEVSAVEHALASTGRIRAIARLGWPATMDGGDVIRVGGRVFVGLTERTNTEAVLQLRAILGDAYTVTPVEVDGVLHLKSACTLLDERTLLVDPTCADTGALGGFDLVEVPSDEGYAANCLSLGGLVVVSEGFPRTRELVAAAGERRGFNVVELGMSEFRKAGGSLTCLSILL